MTQDGFGWWTLLSVPTGLLGLLLIIGAFESAVSEQETGEAETEANPVSDSGS